jgi:hypothetical protein
MRHGSVSIFLGIIALVLAGASLSAQTKKVPGVPPAAAPADRTAASGFEATGLLRQLDTDRDGFISQKEWNDFFPARDQNGDRRLSSEEIQSGLNQKVSEEILGANYGRLAAFARLDANRNDGIDASEWPGKNKDFRYLDANQNDSLSREEFLSKNGRWWNETFENLDFNGDKIIIRSEWLDSDASFDRLDRNRNGAIDRREFYSPR